MNQADKYGSRHELEHTNQKYYVLNLRYLGGGRRWYFQRVPALCARRRARSSKSNAY